MMRLTLCLASLLVLTYAAPQESAQEVGRTETNGDIIPGEYIIVMRESVSIAAIADYLKEVNIQHDSRIGKRPFLAVADMNEEVAEILKKNPLVYSIEENRVVMLDDPVQDNVGVRTVKGLKSDMKMMNVCTYERMVNDMWTYNLIRTSNIDLPDWDLDLATYSFKDRGENAQVFILDTGIDITHDEFLTIDGKRTRAHNAFIADGLVSQGYNDQNGHGTHCAGTAVGRMIGAAKDAEVYNVKVLGRNGSGTSLGVIEGINFVAEWARSAHKANLKINPIASLSLSSPTPTEAQQTAIQAAIAEGVMFVVSAGNTGASADTRWPAAWPESITCGATDSQDRLASFSNWGPLVDISGPGVDIWSAGASEAQRCYGVPLGECYISMSGTSMSTPLVAGISARYMSATHRPTNPADNQEILRTFLHRESNHGKISWELTDQTGTYNRLLYFNDCNNN